MTTFQTLVALEFAALVIEKLMPSPEALVDFVVSPPPPFCPNRHEAGRLIPLTVRDDPLQIHN
jgi:hypothetical protein